MIQWTEEQNILANTIRDWSSELNEKRNYKDDCDLFLQQWETVKKMGILGLPVDENYGGLGQDILTTMYALEAFGNICEDEGLSFGLSSHIVSTLVPINKFGSPAQKDRYLPELCTGDKIGAHAITETDTGSDAWKMKTFAKKNDKGFVLNGSKTFISNGPIADTFIIYAKTNEKASALGGFTAFIVDRDTKGFTIGDPIKKMGLHTSTLCDLYFDDCQLTQDNVLGKEGRGFSIFNYVMNWEIICSFILNVGEMERLLKKCIAYSKQRQQYGQPISKFQAISHKIANMKIALDTSRTMLYSAGWAFQEGKNVTTDMSVAKIVASEYFVQSSLDAIQIFGGYGYMQESGIEKYLRNSVASKIYSGTSEVQRNTIASMLGL